MDFRHTTLANGLTIIGEPNPIARSMALGFFVRTGARDESPELHGCTHFLEHMVFKGTPRRTAMQVNIDFDRIGANYNAYTSEENTVFHAAVLPEYLPQAVDILTDILRPSLRPEDFDMEKKVIIEEIQMYADEPMWSVYDEAKTLFFGPHPLARSVLGTVSSITALTRDQMAEYFQRRYVASNITVVAAGNYDWQSFVDLIASACGAWPQGSASRDLPRAQPQHEFKVLTKATLQQEHMFLLMGGPPADSPLRYAAEILAHAVGDDTGSRLYWELVDPGWADSADLSFHEYDGAGAYFCYLSGPAAEAQRNLERAMKVFRAVQAEGLTEQELRVAKSKIGSRIVRGNERPMGRMQSLGFLWTYLRTYRTLDEELALLDRVTLADLRQLLDEYPITEPTIAALGPCEKLTCPA
jgi:predicted Zn-dependent peptidase